MSEKIRARLGYLKRDEIPERIANKEIDAYDIIFTLDTKECIIISPELELHSLHCRVRTYESVSEAETDLNQREDTYEGQIVSIISHSAYSGYIVNKNIENQFFVTPLNRLPEIDYNTLGNRPIVNLTGTLDDPVVIENLATGIYTIKGQYTISSQLETVFLSAASNLFIVEKDNEDVYIKKIGAKEILTYVVSASGVKSDFILTSDYLTQQGYATTAYVDAKIEALDFITKEESEAYITSIVTQILDASLDERVSTKVEEVLSEQLVPIEENSIVDLFI